MAVSRSPLHLKDQRVGDARLLVIEGTLDSTTYLPVRDAIIKAATDQPSAVVVDVTALSIPDQTAWTVFASARWRVCVWPDVPVLLVCPAQTAPATVRRYVPTFGSVTDALADLPAAGRRGRRRARAELAAVPGSEAAASSLVAEWLTQWDQTAFIGAARTAAVILMGNAIAHCGGTAALRVETDGSSVVVAVEDTSSTAPTRHEADVAPRKIDGLRLVDAVARTWGHHPSPHGKVVWAVIGPENCL